MEFFTTLKDTPVPTLLIIGGLIFLFLGIATIKKPIVIDVMPSSRKTALVLGVILVGTGLYLLSQPFSELPKEPTGTSTPEIVFNVNKEETNGCYVRFNGFIMDNTSKDPITWEWGDGNFTKGFFPQEHTYTNSGSYSVTVTAPSGLTKTFIIEVNCQAVLSPPVINQRFRLRNNENPYCLASIGNSQVLDNQVGMGDCDSPSAIWLWDGQEIHNGWNPYCLASIGDSKEIYNTVVMGTCNQSNAIWQWNGQEVQNGWNPYCLASVGTSKEIDNPVLMGECGLKNAQWYIETVQ
jgi:hypothetical protein